MTKHSYYKYSIWNTCHSCIICCDSRNRDHTESSRKSSTRSPTVHCKCSDPGGVGLTHPNNLYTVFNIMDVLGHLVSSPQELMDISVKQLHQEYELATLTQIKEMVILKLLPIPQKWWVRQPHVENPCWSSMNMKFRIMNAGSWGTGTHTEQRILFAKTGGESFNVHYVFKAQTKKFIC